GSRRCRTRRRAGRAQRIRDGGHEALGHLTNAAGDVREGLVWKLPRDDRPPVLREGLQAPERGGMPVARPEDDRDDARRTRLVTLHRPGDLNIAAVPRGEEVGTDQQEDQISPVEVLADDLVPLPAGFDAAVVPVFDDPLVPQRAQMVLELLPQRFILVLIGAEDADRSRETFWDGHGTQVLLHFVPGLPELARRRGEVDGAPVIAAGCGRRPRRDGTDGALDLLVHLPPEGLLLTRRHVAE